MTTTTVSINPEHYPALSAGSGILKTIRFNLGGEAVTPRDLNRIHVPLGGSTIWTVAEGDGEETAHKVLAGIIVHIARRRAYWSRSEPSGDPPDCSSSDCLQGVGAPGGRCGVPAERLRHGPQARRQPGPRQGLQGGQAALPAARGLPLARRGERAGVGPEGPAAVPAQAGPALLVGADQPGPGEGAEPGWPALRGDPAQRPRRALPRRGRRVAAYARALQGIFPAVTVRQADVRDA